MDRFNVNGKQFKWIIFGCSSAVSDSHRVQWNMTNKIITIMVDACVRFWLVFCIRLARLLLPSMLLIRVNSMAWFRRKHQLDRVKLTHHNSCSKWSPATILIENAAMAAATWWGSILCVLRKTFSQHLIEFVLIFDLWNKFCGTGSTFIVARAPPLQNKPNTTTTIITIFGWCFFVSYFLFYRYPAHGSPYNYKLHNLTVRRRYERSVDTAVFFFFFFLSFSFDCFMSI